MKVKITLPSELDVPEISYDPVKREITMEPSFYGKGVESMVGVLEVRLSAEEAKQTKEVVTYRGQLRLSGARGKLTLLPRNESVRPALLRTLDGGTSLTEALASQRKKQK